MHDPRADRDQPASEPVLNSAGIRRLLVQPGAGTTYMFLLAATNYNGSQSATSFLAIACPCREVK